MKYWSKFTQNGRFLTLKLWIPKNPDVLEKNLKVRFVFSIQKCLQKNILELKTDKSWNLTRSVIIIMLDLNIISILSYFWRIEFVFNITRLVTMISAV